MKQVSKLKEENIRKANYKIEKYIITSENISNFTVMENRRQIGEIHVGKIHKALLTGKNPIGILIVNKRNNQLRLIDGNHRLEALKRFYSYYKSNKEVKVECILKVYENLTDEEERSVYTDEARRRNESHEDRLNMFKDSLTFWKLIDDKLNKFPFKVTIYNAKDGIKFRVILNAIFTSKTSESVGFFPKTLGKDDLVEFCMDLDYNDFVVTKEFAEFFVNIFGEVNSNNIFTRSQFFIPLFDIYVKNRDQVKTSTFIPRFIRIIRKPDIIQFLNLSGREAQSRLREIMLSYMNHGFSTHQFK